jgi:flagellar basal-body rod protein FlgF
MDNTTYIALANQLALTRQMDIVANNIANANTTAFKGERVLFTNYLADLGPGQDQQLNFPQDIGVSRNFEEGSLTPTGNSLDLAISGDGFFAVNAPNGTRYTRAGAFALNTQGQIVDLAGDTVLDEHGNPIAVAPGQTQVSVSQDGTVSTESGQLARLQLVRFDDPNNLSAEGANLFDAGGATPIPASASKVIQGSIEGSNIQPVTELTHLLQIQHGIEAAQRVISAENDRQTKMIDALTKDA